MTRYDQLPILTRQQYFFAVLIGSFTSFVACYSFYQSLPISALSCGLGFYAPQWYRKRYYTQLRAQLTLQFKEALYSIRTSLAAGRSVENSFIAAADDLSLIYPLPDTMIRREFAIIRLKLANQEPLERILQNFAQRAMIESITQFVDVFTICKRTGGNLVDVIQQTSQAINDSIDMQQEMEVMIAQKKFEARILLAVPFVMMAFLNVAASDYMATLYSFKGYCLLTGALLVLLLCFRWIYALTTFGTSRGEL